MPRVLGLLVTCLIVGAPSPCLLPAGWPRSRRRTRRPRSATTSTSGPSSRRTARAATSRPRPRGDYVMTDFAKLLAGGDLGEKAIVAGNPDKSDLVTHDHARRRQGRDARGQEAAGRARDRPDQAVDRRGRRRRHAGQRRSSASTRTIRRSTPGRRSSPRSISRPTASCWPSPASTKCCWSNADERQPGGPAGRPVGAHRVGALLARRQAAGRHRRPAGPHGRGAGLGRRTKRS